MRRIGAGDLDTTLTVEGDDEFGQIAPAFNEMTVKFKKSQENRVEQERMQKEMQVAQEIQHALLPAAFPEIEGYDLATIYQAAKDVGGDYFDFVWIDETTLGIVVADVSGKGVPGSLVMTMIRTAIRLEARGNRSAVDILRRVNDFVSEDVKRGMFVTIFLVVLDAEKRRISFASAGHNPLILHRAAEHKTYFLNPRGIPLGMQLPDGLDFGGQLEAEHVQSAQGRSPGDLHGRGHRGHESEARAVRNGALPVVHSGSRGVGGRRLRDGAQGGPGTVSPATLLRTTISHSWPSRKRWRSTRCCSRSAVSSSIWWRSRVSP